MAAAVAVELRLCALDVADDALRQLRASLSDAERQRVDVLGGNEGRRLAAALGHRRGVLGAELGIDPAAVRYELGAEGKPRLAGDPPRRHFSASRSGAVALIALCDCAEVGVDVEAVPVDPDAARLRRLAARILTPREQAAYEAAARSPGERAAALYACWTRKEAYGKALGTGLVFPLSGIEVWAGDDSPVRCGEIAVHRVELTGVEGFAAAVAVRVGEGTPVAVGAPTPVCESG